MGRESFRPRLKLKVELKLWSSLQALTAFCYSGLDQQGSDVHFWSDGTAAVQFNPQPEGTLYSSCSSHCQHLQPSNCHCWDRESSQIAIATYPLMLSGSATAKHWPTDTWYSQLFFCEDKKNQQHCLNIIKWLAYTRKKATICNDSHLKQWCSVHYCFKWLSLYIVTAFILHIVWTHLHFST